MNRYQTSGIIIFLARQALTLTSFIHWNNDIPSSIIPGLQCWYCNIWQAPYGILWHIISYPGILVPTTTFFAAYTNTIDLAAMLSIIRYRKMSLVYQICSVWIWLQAPYDLPILWLTILGLKYWPLTFLGPVAKIPPLFMPKVWNYVLSKPYNVNDIQYYLLMGTVFVAVLGQQLYLYRGRKKRQAWESLLQKNQN